MRIIKCKETGKIYKGLTELRKELGCCYYIAHDGLKNGVWKRGNHTYILLDEYGHQAQFYKMQTVKPILEIKTGRIFKSVTEASEQLGFCRETVAQKAQERKELRFLKPKETEKLGMVDIRGKKAVTIIDVVTGETWNSYSTCAKALQVSIGSLFYHIRDKIVVRGHHLERLDVYETEYTDEEKVYLKGLKR